MRNRLFRNLKIILSIIFIIALISAVIFLFYSFTIAWQAIAATIITALLLIFIVLLIILITYLWVKITILRRKLKTYQIESDRIKKELNKCKDNQRKITKLE